MNRRSQDQDTNLSTETGQLQLPSTDDPEALGAFTYNLRFPGQMFDGQAGLHQNMYRDYSPAIGRYTESDPIGLNGGINTYGYVGGSPADRFDPFGLDWIEYNGRQVTYYGGAVGDRSDAIRKCTASSGFADQYRDYQRAWLRGKDYGPVPDGLWRIDLRPDPSRVARIHPSGENLYANAAGGIEAVGRSYVLPGGVVTDAAASAWGSWRARLSPVNVPRYRTGNYYLHDSSKGYTHGCIETCSNLLNDILQYRMSGATSMDVLVDYRYAITGSGAR